MTKSDRHISPTFLLLPFRKVMSRSQYKFLDAYLRPNMTVLDDGSGPGFFTMAIAERIGRGGKVIAVDGNEVAIMKLKKRVSKFEISNVEAYPTSASNLNMIPTESVDVVFSNGMLCCMSDHEGAVSELFRVMKEGGIAYISVTAFGRDELSVSNTELDHLLQRFEKIKTFSGRFQYYVIVTKPRTKLS